MTVCATFFAGDTRYRDEAMGVSGPGACIQGLGSSLSQGVYADSVRESVQMKSVGKPDAGNPHVRFDERDVETEQGVDSEAPATERVGYR